MKCSNKLCEKEFDNKFEKCPYCGTPINAESNSSNTEDYFNYDTPWEGSLFAIPSKIGNFIQEMPLKKALLILFAEIALGVLFLIIGYVTASAAGTGNNDASAACNLFGMIFLCHSIYCLVKRIATDYLNKKKKDWDDRKKKMAVYLLLIVFSIILSLPALFNLNKTGAGLEVFIFFIAIGIFIASIYSFFKYLIKPYTDKKEKRRYEEIIKKYNIDSDN